MPKILYYAHSMKIYGTEREQEELDMIQAAFPQDVIYSPNRPFIQNHKDPMKACLDVILDMDTLVFSLEKRHVSSGVLLEVKHAQKHNIPVFVLQYGNVIEFSGAFRKVTRNKKSFWTV